jgi:hypothetical protein
MEAFSPFPIEELEEVIDGKKYLISVAAFIGGLLGGVLAFLMQTYAAVIDYPINVGGRPLLSWQSFIPVTFEMAVLGAAVFAAFSMLYFNGFPELWHPVFDSLHFERASRDRFFLCLLARDPLYKSEQVLRLIEELKPLSICEVQNEN